MRRYRWTWPSLRDPERALARRLGATYQPAFFAVDARGRLVAAHHGGGSPRVWRALAARARGR